MTVVFIVLFFLILFAIGFLLVQREERNLRSAPVGAQRIEAVKASQVAGKVSQYARLGWSVENQSTAKSLGSQARVTITFRKTAQAGR